MTQRNMQNNLNIHLSTKYGNKDEQMHTCSIIVSVLKY